MLRIRSISNKTIAFATLSVAMANNPAFAGTLSFQEAVDAALKHDSEYQQSLANFSAEKESETISKSALLPNINFSSGYSYERSDNIYTDPDSDYYQDEQVRSSGELDETYWQFSLRQPIVNLEAYRGFKASLSATAAASLRLAQAEQTLIYRTTERYLSVLYNAQLVFLNQSIHKTLSAKYQQEQRRSILGVGDELQLLELEARRDLAKTDHLKAKSDLEDEQTKLAVITGVTFTPPESWIRYAHTAHTPEPALSSPAATLAEKNLNYREGVVLLEKAKIDLSSSKAANYPTLSFGLDYRENTSNDPFRDRKDFTASINLSMNLYAGGKTSASIRQASALLSAQQAKIKGIFSNSEQKISLAISRKRNIEERLRALKRSLESSERYLTAAERGLDLNLRSQIDVLDARTQLLDVQLRLANAINQYLLADLQLQYQTGSLSKSYVAFYDRFFNAGLE